MTQVLPTRPAVPPGLRYDPYDYDIDRDPHPTWKRLRDEAPIYYDERHDFYALSRYDDVLAALLDWHTYSSARGTVLEMIDTGGVHQANTADDLGQMIFTDPPGHDVARAIVNRSFTPRHVGHLADRIRSLCRDKLDEHAGSGGFDFLGDFAARIPPMIIGELLGVPEADQEDLGHWVDDMMFYDPAVETGDRILGIMQANPRRSEGARRVGEYLVALVDERTARPADDLISHLVQAEVETASGPRHLSRRELVGFATLLQGAGSETTARLLGWAAVLLARHPDERAALVADPTLVANGVEELLRYEAPSPVQGRLVTTDVEWHGVRVPAMSRMLLLNGAAGRDEREYPDPDRFDVRRHMDRHMTFGYSTHFCLGAALARLEGRVVIEEMLARIPEWDVDESQVEMVHTTTVRGPAKVPIRF